MSILSTDVDALCSTTCCLANIFVPFTSYYLWEWERKWEMALEQFHAQHLLQDFFKVRMCLMGSHPSSHFTQLPTWSCWSLSQLTMGYLAWRFPVHCSPVCNFWVYNQPYPHGTRQPYLQVNLVQGNSWESNSALCSCETKALSIEPDHASGKWVPQSIVDQKGWTCVIFICPMSCPIVCHYALHIVIVCVYY